MRVGESLGEHTNGSADKADAAAGGSHSLKQHVRQCVRRYLEELDGEDGTDVYQMVLAEMEAPLLEEVMRHTRNNQTRASQMLGLNRGTLRKKLKQYGLLKENGN
ncbi:MAG: DNA-binding transcriptional regulator Fis [Halieaceae bacterium]|jgi:Fis family transcriptional regulator|nr:DNA-binding transcriptional regulator Fis [Halieaceae bacterium]